MKKKWRLGLIIGITLLIGIGGGWWLNNISDNKAKGVKISEQGKEINGDSEFKNKQGIFVSVAPLSPTLEDSEYLVTRVVDGDTIDVNMGGSTQRVRLIGIDTPESVDPRQAVECFGKEASLKLKGLIEGRKVRLEADASQDNKDKYGRILRYVWDGEENINLWMIREGYAFEYTYRDTYKYQAQFKETERTAREAKVGLWSPSSCNGDRKLKTSEVLGLNDTGETKNEEVNQESQPAGCVIKGNINTKDEKIYHLPGCGSYEKTQIDASRGERWFCTEAEAVSAGWRKAGNCN